MAKRRSRTGVATNPPDYASLLTAIGSLIGEARRAGARAVNAAITRTYWEVGRYIVDFEQSGKKRAAYGDILLQRLAGDLTRSHGRGFGVANLSQMRKFYQLWPVPGILQTPSEKSGSDNDHSQKPVAAFPLPWSHYVRLLSLEKAEARSFYEVEALRGGWSVRQMVRQINSQFFERTLLSRNKVAMLAKATESGPEDGISAEEEIKDPFVLEFLDLKDEYSETDLEEALIHRLETFLLELGDDFAFIGRQRRLRIDDQWFRVDLLFFHRRLRALVIIDLKTGEFTHADAGQMHLYVNYARENWMREGENPPVCLILCAQKGHNVARYALEGLPNKVLASTYRTTLPDEALLTAELEKSQRLLASRMGNRQ
jgi:predicted nuclease of restriction endonuclease-like (RecB) superfamily